MLSRWLAGCVVFLVGLVGWVPPSGAVDPIDGGGIADVDPPVASQLSPKPAHHTSDLRQRISVRVEDASSGVGSMSMTLDGVEVSATWNPVARSLSYVPDVDLTVDHTYVVEVTATDLVGNTATETWPFRVIAVTAGSAGVSVAGATTAGFSAGATEVLVDPDAVFGPVAVELSSTISTGTGTATVSAPLLLEATFADGTTTVVETVDLGEVSAGGDYAIVAPGEDAQRLVLPQLITDLGTVTLDVPAELQAAGGEVTIAVVEGTTAAVTLATDPLAGDLECPEARPCEITGTIHCTYQTSAGPSECTGTHPEIWVDVPAEGRRWVVGRAASPQTDRSQVRNGLQISPCHPLNRHSGVSCESAKYAAVVQLGGHRPGEVGYLFEAYSYSEAFDLRGPGFEHVLVWQQSDGRAGTIVCRGDGVDAPVATGTLMEVGQSVYPEPSMARHGYWDGLDYSAGTELADVDPPVAIEHSDSWGASMYRSGRQVNLGDVVSSAGALQGELRTPLDEAYVAGAVGELPVGPEDLQGAVSQYWRPSAEAAQARFEMTAGSQFDWAELGAEQRIVSSLHFRFSYVNDGCAV